MNRHLTIVIFITIMIFGGQICFAQSGLQQVDTARVNHTKTESSENRKNKNAKTELKGEQVNDQNNKGNQTIKQVNGARPDMSKARGARPPYIERPAGSGMPKGIGKPGGAVKVGKR